MERYGQRDENKAFTRCVVMYKYKGYVALKDTGASMPFSFECKHYSLNESELISFIGNVLNEAISNIQVIQEYKVIKNK